MSFSIGILLRFLDMNPRPMGPIDTSSQSLSINTSKSEPFRNNLQFVKKRWFFKYVKRDTLIWRRVRGRGNMVLQQDIRLCKCLKNLVLYMNKCSLPPKFNNFSVRSSHYARFHTPELVAVTRGATLGMPRIRLQAFITVCV